MLYTDKVASPGEGVNDGFTVKFTPASQEPFRISEQTCASNVHFGNKHTKINGTVHMQNWCGTCGARVDSRIDISACIFQKEHTTCDTHIWSQRHYRPCIQDNRVFRLTQSCNDDRDDDHRKAGPTRGYLISMDSAKTTFSTYLSLDVDICASLQEFLDDILVALVAGPHEGRPATLRENTKSSVRFTS